MKLVSILFLSLFLGKSCSSQTKIDLKTAIVEYTANSRGFYQNIVIQNKTVTLSNDRRSVEKPVVTTISDEDWKELIDDVEQVQLDSLATLKAPTQKRFYDGAAIANLKIIFKGKTFGTSAFDHGFPPEAIQRLVVKINSFAKKQK